MAFEGSFVSKIQAMLYPEEYLEEEKEAQIVYLPPSYYYDEDNFNLWKKIYFPCVREDDPFAIRAVRYSFHLIQEVILGKGIPSEVMEPAYCTLKNNILSFNNKFAVSYTKAVRPIDVRCYEQFEEECLYLCGIYWLTDKQYDWMDENMTWKKIIGMFTFALCLSHKYRNEEDRVEEISRFLAKFIINFAIRFIQRSGGWENMVIDLPEEPEPILTDWISYMDEIKQREAILKNDSSAIKTIAVWSGLCVGSVVTTMFYLSRRT